MSALELLCMLIKKHEGCRLKAYYCPAGILTCGWGSTGKDIFLNTVWTQEYADARMLQDAKRFLKQTLQLCPNLEGSQLAAIADFAYNLGTGRLEASTLRKCLNNNDIDGAVKQLKKWNKGRVKGKLIELPGLTKRRLDECNLLIRT